MKMTCDNCNLKNANEKKSLANNKIKKKLSSCDDKQVSFSLAHVIVTSIDLIWNSHTVSIAVFHFLIYFTPIYTLIIMVNGQFELMDYFSAIK